MQYNFPENDTISIPRLRSTTKEYPLNVSVNNVEGRKAGVHVAFENVCRKEQTLLDSNNKNEALKASYTNKGNVINHSAEKNSDSLKIE